MYTFVRCRPHPKVDAESWYVKVSKDDLPLFERLHKAVSVGLFQRYVMDPHYFKDGNEHRPNSELGDLIAPMRLGGGWCMTMEKIFHEHGCAFVNSSGGITTPMEVLEERKSETLHFPENPSRPSVRSPEVITISQFPAGDHYYLKSTQGRLFSPEKYNTFDEAYAVALKYTSQDHIYGKKVEIPKRKHEGD